MRQVEVLVRKLLAVDRLATRAVAVGEVTALEHEVWDDAVEFAALVAEAARAGAQLLEVGGGLRHLLVEEAHRDAPTRLATDADVKVDLCLRAWQLTGARHRGERQQTQRTEHACDSVRARATARAARARQGKLGGAAERAYAQTETISVFLCLSIGRQCATLRSPHEAHGREQVWCKGTYVQRLAR